MVFVLFIFLAKVIVMLIKKTGFRELTGKNLGTTWRQLSDVPLPVAWNGGFPNNKSIFSNILWDNSRTRWCRKEPLWCLIQPQWRKSPRPRRAPPGELWSHFGFGVLSLPCQTTRSQLLDHGSNIGWAADVCDALNRGPTNIDSRSLDEK